jgi:hypothetical protein
MSSYLVNLVDVLGGIASIAGLAVSFFAWRRASEAKSAAREARDAILKNNASEDLQSVTAIAKELLAAVEGGHLDVASKCGRDLVAHVNQTKQRWILTAESKERLDEAAVRIARLSLALAKRAGVIDAEERAKLLKFAHDVVVTLAQETGKMQLVIERKKE